MNITKIKIENFKSIKSLEINEPNPFSVFVGSNAAGKSNIFEALEFMSLCTSRDNPVSLFEGVSQVSNFNSNSDDFYFQLGDYKNYIFIDSKYSKDKFNIITEGVNTKTITEDLNTKTDYVQFIKNFSRLFIGFEKYVKEPINDDSKLRLDGDNLEQVLYRLLNDENLNEEFKEWLSLFIPDFKDIEVIIDSLTNKKNLHFFEEYYNAPFSTSLVSDGTRNILILLSALYQSKEPQFLCIEEPENGLNPYIIRELVKMFRKFCKEKKFYIWLTTHSQTLVSELKPIELILVNKKNGLTEIKYARDLNIEGIRMDEAWLSNIYGAGVPW
ncbi:MAG: AAA family ATPase [Ignavibacteria bacterium]|nr:AAA family ATPase [Ignavibacteria bacterium]